MSKRAFDDQRFVLQHGWGRTYLSGHARCSLVRRLDGVRCKEYDVSAAFGLDQRLPEIRIEECALCIIDENVVERVQNRSEGLHVRHGTRHLPQHIPRMLNQPYFGVQP